MEATVDEIKQCTTQYVLAINDTLNVMSGKWKIPIIVNLTKGKKRFNEIQRSLGKITPRMLSKELKELELNGMIVKDETDATYYSLTHSATSFEGVLDAMLKWGLEHRKNSLQ